jgi:hypothetical protein
VERLYHSHSIRELNRASPPLHPTNLISICMAIILKRPVQPVRFPAKHYLTFQYHAWRSAQIPLPEIAAIETESASSVRSDNCPVRSRSMRTSARIQRGKIIQAAFAQNAPHPYSSKKRGIPFCTHWHRKPVRNSMDYHQFGNGYVNLQASPPDFLTICPKILCFR